jgi:exopolysaccharide biosynthesis predicted pyruvyltransferase EpsI
LMYFAVEKKKKKIKKKKNILLKFHFCENVSDHSIEYARLSFFFF